jgi:hypothetical protein
LDAIDRSGVEVSQAQEAFDGIESILNTPALIIESNNALWGKDSRVSDIGQVSIPLTTKMDFERV